MVIFQALFAFFWPQRRGLWLLAAAISVFGGAQTPYARSPLEPDSQLCQIYAQEAERQLQIPPHLLRAIAEVESGRQIKDLHRAWPWTLHARGRGYYFESQLEAQAEIKRLLRSGLRNMDIGCMQVNWRYHGQEFRSPAQLLNPVTNVAYAATFLLSLRKDARGWHGAIARYHSRDPERGRRYLKRVLRRQAVLSCRASRFASRARRACAGD